MTITRRGAIASSRVVAASGGTFQFRLRAAVNSSFEYRIDGGAWIALSLVGGSPYQTLPAVPIAIAAGAHTIDIRQITTANTVYCDFVDVTVGATTTRYEAVTTGQGTAGAWFTSTAVAGFSGVDAMRTATQGGNNYLRFSVTV